jgi:hypothetical protein
MTKGLLGLLLVANVGFFAWMQWGSALTTEVDTPSVQTQLNPQKIKLVSESALASAVSVSSVAASQVEHTLALSAAIPAMPIPAEMASAAKGKLLCMEWGEFSGEGLLQAQAGLDTLQLGGKLSQRINEHASGFWVFMPPLKTPAAIKRKIDQLNKLGVKDHFVVQEEGEWLNAISLGVFKSEAAAQKYLESIQTLGVRSAKVGERMSKLKFTVFVLKGVDPIFVGKMGALKQNFPDSELKVTACN